MSFSCSLPLLSFTQFKFSCFCKFRGEQILFAPRLTADLRLLPPPALRFGGCQGGSFVSPHPFSLFFNLLSFLLLYYYSSPIQLIPRRRRLRGAPQLPGGRIGWGICICISSLSLHPSPYEVELLLLCMRQMCLNMLAFMHFIRAFSFAVSVHLLFSLTSELNRWGVVCIVC